MYICKTKRYRRFKKAIQKNTKGIFGELVGNPEMN